MIDDGMNIFNENIYNQDLMMRIAKMESAEEKLHNIIARNKELDMRQEQKVLRASEQSVKTYMNGFQDMEDNIRAPAPAVVSKDIRETLKDKRKRLESDSEVQLFMKEKLKAKLDKNNKVISYEAEGDLSLRLESAEYKDVVLKIRPDTSYKYSPNLSKDLAKEGLLKSSKSYPIGKNLALIKWKTSKVERPPFNFTYWPSELEDGRYQILFEFSAEEDLLEVVLYFNLSKIKDVLIENGKAEIGEYLEWNIGSISKYQSESIEFSCDCDSGDDIFPINVYFNGVFLNKSVEIERISIDNEAVDYGVQCVCEVDEFEIVNVD